MNKERYNQIIDEAYNYYLQNWEPNREIEEIEDPYGLIRGTNFINDRPLDKDMFIFCIKKDPEFSEKWGLKIEERELSLFEKTTLYSTKTGQKDWKERVETTIENQGEEILNKEFEKHKIPTKIITLTYNNEKIESYE